MTRRTAVITGGASGIGEACARRFANDGAHVWLLDSDEDRANQVAAGIETDGGTARALAVDVSDAAAVDNCAAKIKAESGAPDVLVTSAGILEHTSAVLDIDLEDHDRLWQVNYHGTMHACRAFGRLMCEQGTGALVTVGSVNSFAPLPLPAYNPSKVAVMRLTELLAMEFGRHGVRVNGVAPTYVLTPALKAKIESGERDADTIRGSGALDMFVRPEHIADAVAFLCSDQAAVITGVMLPVDAGWCLAAPYKAFAGGVPWDQ